MSARRYIHTRQSGQELLEFGLVLPILLLIVVGVADLGRLFHATITIANASRRGARYAISYGYQNIGGVVTIDKTATINRTQNEAQNSGITLDSITVICPPVDNCVQGGPVRVSVTHDFQFWITLFVGSGMTLSHNTEMKIPW